MASAAIDSGGGFPYASRQEIIPALENALNINEKPAPSYLVQNRRKTWFDHYLYALKAMLDSELDSGP